MSESSKLPSRANRPEKEELDAARHAVMVVARAIKNRSIYPEDHSGIAQLIQSAMGGLAGFHKKYGSLRLTVTQNALLYKGQPVLEAEQSNDPVIYPMYRDGLIWIEFTPGIDDGEVRKFIDILVAHRKLEQETDSDLVTTLWDSDFIHIQHEAIDPELESTPSLDIAAFRIVTENRAEKRSQILSGTPPPAPRRPMPELLSDQDRNTLRCMIDQEATDKPEDILDVLLILLVNQTSEKEFWTVLESLAETFSEALAQADINFCLRCQRAVQNLLIKTEQKSRWRWQLLNKFRELLCDSPGWTDLTAQIKRHPFSAGQAENLSYLLRSLPGKIMQPAAMLLAAAKDQSLRQPLIEVIALHARTDPEQFRNILSKIESTAVLDLLEVAERFEKHLLKPILVELSAHKDSGVRARAIWMLSKQDPGAIVQLFKLIDDPESSVRKQIIVNLGREKNPVAEDLLLKYLQSGNAFSKGKDHLLACYQALGKCGSNRCLPFLKQMLFASPWKDTVNRKRTAHRKGAAIALALLQTPAGEQLLNKGLKSLVPYIKKACRTAIEQVQMKSSTKGKTDEHH